MKKILDQHPLLILMGLLLASVALGVHQYYPVYLQRKALKQILQKHSAKLDEIQAYSERLPILHQQVRELEPRAAEFARRFPEQREFSRLWRQIAEMMNRHHLSDQLVRPGTVFCNDSICYIPLEIQCRGTFEELFQFFRSLEQYDRLIRFEEVHLSNDETFTGQLTLKAQACVFYQSEEPQKEPI